MLWVIPLGLALLYRYFPLTWRTLWLTFYYCYCSCSLFLFLYCYGKMQFFIHWNFHFVKNISLLTYFTLLLTSFTLYCLLWMFHIRFLKNNSLFLKILFSLLCLYLAASFIVLSLFCIFQPLWSSKFLWGQITNILMSFACKMINTGRYITSCYIMY